MSIKLSELKAMEEVVTTAPETLTARQVAGQALRNIPESGMQYGKDILTALTDPIGTAKSIGELGLGIIQLVSNYLGLNIMNEKMEIILKKFESKLNK